MGPCPARHTTAHSRRRVTSPLPFAGRLCPMYSHSPPYSVTYYWTRRRRGERSASAPFRTPYFDIKLTQNRETTRHTTRATGRYTHTVTVTHTHTHTHTHANDAHTYVRTLRHTVEKIRVVSEAFPVKPKPPKSWECSR